MRQWLLACLLTLLAQGGMPAPRISPVPRARSAAAPRTYARSAAAARGPGRNSGGDWEPPPAGDDSEVEERGSHSEGARRGASRQPPFAPLGRSGPVPPRLARPRGSSGAAWSLPSPPPSSVQAPALAPRLQLELASLGYTEEEMAAVRPEVAREIAEKGLTRPRTGMPQAWRTRCV